MKITNSARLVMFGRVETKTRETGRTRSLVSEKNPIYNTLEFVFSETSAWGGGGKSVGFSC